MMGGGNKQKMKMLGKKGAVLAVLLLVMLVGSASAWTVLTGATGGGVHGTIKKAEATIDNAGWIDLGNVGSGYSFSASDSGNVTVINAKELNVTFSVTGLDSSEKAVMVSGSLKIVRVGVAVLGTIDLTAGTLDTISTMLPEGTHEIRYEVSGVATYPAADKFVEFLVNVGVKTP